MNRYQKFLSLLTGLVVFNTVTIGGFNAFVDPYNVVNSQPIPKLNQSKPESGKDARQFKAINVIRIKPKTVLLGNSRTDIGLDPSHPVLTSHSPTYNLAIPGGDMYQAMRYFQHALANQPDLKQVVIGIDLVAFEQRDDIEQLDPKLEEILEETEYVQHLPNLIFSSDTLLSSFSTVLSNLADEPMTENYLSDGRLIRVHPPDLSTQEIFRVHLKKAYFHFWYDDYEISQTQLDAFRTIVETCNQRGIDLKVFISPAHATQWEAVHAKELWSTFEAWKREIVEITPVWDFSGYNSITTEPLTEDMQHYLDSAHYVKEIGDLVLNRLFEHQTEKVPDDFGVLLTPDTIESHLAQIRDQRERWASQNLEVVQLVEQWSKEP
ncbi:MAG: hypothetical protein Kow00121_13130 [Elainellaceae cyanobacterium]